MSKNIFVDFVHNMINNFRGDSVNIIYLLKKIILNNIIPSYSPATFRSFFLTEFRSIF